MFGSIRIATIRGIPIHLHITLLAMFAVLIVRMGPAVGIPAGFILFGSVLLHELGHALVAQRYHIHIASIVLHLLGGMALMTRPPERPKHELLIAAAGPAVSFALGIVLALVATVAGIDLHPGRLLSGPIDLRDLLGLAALINLTMGIFNLIPALPMDGGRIFRAVLTGWMGAMGATRFAAWVSRIFGVAFIAIGLSLKPRAYALVIVGVMLFLMVANELRVTEAQENARLKKEERPDLRETREEFIDAFGRRYVVTTRMIDEPRS